MASWLSLLKDPMIAVLLLATALAVIVPSVGNARDMATVVSNGAIFLLFLVNGMRIARGDVARGLGNWHFFLPLACWVFGAMALVGLGFARLAEGNLPPLVALGFLYLGTLPSTIQSATSYTTMAGGNAALSVIGAALINIVGVFISAPLFALLGGGEAADTGTGVIIRIALLLVLPFVMGQLIQGWTWDWIDARRSRIVWLDRIVIGIAVYVAFSGAVVQGLGQAMDFAAWCWLIALILALLAFANAGVWAFSAVMRYPLKDRVAFLFAGSQKSVAIGAPLAALLFPPEAAGFVIAPLLLYHLIQLMAAAPLATLLARRIDQVG